MSGNCEGVTDHVPGATIIRPLGVTLLPLTIDAGMASSRMTVSAGPLTVTVKDITQSGTLELPIAPSSPRFSIQFAGDGTLECLAGATRVTGFAIDPPLGTRTAISIDGATSTWTRGVNSTSPVRACATGSSVARSAIVAFVDDDGAEAGRVDCSGGVIERVAVMRVAPPTGSFWVRVGDIESRWSSRVAASDARLCIGTPGDIELGPVAAGHQVTLP